MESMVLNLSRIDTFDSTNTCSYTISTSSSNNDGVPLVAPFHKLLRPLTVPSSSLTTSLTLTSPLASLCDLRTFESSLSGPGPASSAGSSTAATSGSETLTNSSCRSPTSTLSPSLGRNFTVLSGMIESFLNRIRKPSKQLREAMIGIRCFLTMIEPVMVEMGSEEQDYVREVLESLEKVIGQLICQSLFNEIECEDANLRVVGYDSTSENESSVIDASELLWTWEDVLPGVWKPVKNKSVQKKVPRQWARFGHRFEKAHWKLWLKLPLVKRKKGDWYLGDWDDDEGNAGNERRWGGRRRRIDWLRGETVVSTMICSSE